MLLRAVGRSLLGMDLGDSQAAKRETEHRDCGDSCNDFHSLVVLRFTSPPWQPRVTRSGCETLDRNLNTRSRTEMATRNCEMNTQKRDMNFNFRQEQIFARFHNDEVAHS